MKKYSLFIIILILSLTLRWDAFAEDSSVKLEKIVAQIHTLNLLNGLELNNQQMQLVLNTAHQAESIRLKAKEEIAQKEEEIINTYDRVLSVLKNGSLVIPENIVHRVHRVNQEIDKIKEGAQTRLTALASQIKNNLQPHQLQVLDGYKPCIIPPVERGRIGQADNPSGFVKVLERVYSLPQGKYNFKKDEIAQNAINKLRAKLPPGYILDETKLKTQLLNKMDEARTMSDVDFAIKKEEIAKDIKVGLLPKKPPLNSGVKIERFLLQPEIIPILEQRLPH